MRAAFAAKPWTASRCAPWIASTRARTILVTQPDERIDCSFCVPEYPVDAIKPDTDPGFEKWLSLNAKHGKIWPKITFKKGFRPTLTSGRGSRTRCRPEYGWNSARGDLRYHERIFSSGKAFLCSFSKVNRSAAPQWQKSWQRSLIVLDAPRIVARRTKLSTHCRHFVNAPIQRLQLVGNLHKNLTARSHLTELS